MPNLSLLFTSLQADKTTYLGANTGRDFEDRIKIGLDRIGFNRLTKEDLGDEMMQELKTLCNSHFHLAAIDNPTDYRAHYIHQPFGSQDYPDFLVFCENRIFNIESKFSTGSQRKPVWNSGLPRQHGIYVFASRGVQDITFFVGNDILTEEEARAMHDFFDDKLRRLQNEFNASMKQEYGFAVYVRKAFEQKKKFNSSAVLNFFVNPDRKRLEANVISMTS